MALRTLNRPGMLSFSSQIPKSAVIVPPQRQFSVLSSLISSNNAASLLCKSPTAQLPQILQPFPLQDQSRSVTKFSRTNGKRKTIKAVIKRFYRLDWGTWIRTKTARHKKMWKKTMKRRARLRQHVFVNGTQSWFLDKCVTKFWRKPKYYVDDIYEPYHERPEFFVTKTSKVIK